MNWGHRCTIVENPGGSFGFGQFFLGGYLGLSENLGSPVFFLFSFLLHFYVTIFRALPPLPPPPPVCIYD